MALLQLAVGNLTIGFMTTVRTLEALGSAPAEEGFKALLFGAVLLKKLVQADTYLELDSIAWHGISRVINQLVMI